MRHSSRRRTRGFSLLEMMVAIAILFVLFQRFFNTNSVIFNKTNQRTIIRL